MAWKILDPEFVSNTSFYTTASKALFLLCQCGVVNEAAQLRGEISRLSGQEKSAK